MFCAPFCQDTWIADSYCDEACNVQTCGYDAGDCGIQQFAENLYQVPFNFNSSVKDWNFTIPKQKTVAYWDMTKVFNQYVEIGIIPIVNHKGLQEKSASVIRSISFSDAHKVLTLVLYENVEPSLINVEIRKSVNSAGDSEVIHNFLIHVDTKNSTLRTNKNAALSEKSNKIEVTNNDELSQLESNKSVVTGKPMHTAKPKKELSGVNLANVNTSLPKEKINPNYQSNKTEGAKDDSMNAKNDLNKVVADNHIVDSAHVNNSVINLNIPLEPFIASKPISNQTKDEDLGNKVKQPPSVKNENLQRTLADIHVENDLVNVNSPIINQQQKKSKDAENLEILVQNDKSNKNGAILQNQTPLSGAINENKESITKPKQEEKHHDNPLFVANEADSKTILKHNETKIDSLVHLKSIQVKKEDDRSGLVVKKFPLAYPDDPGQVIKPKDDISVVDNELQKDQIKQSVNLEDPVESMKVKENISTIEQEQRIQVQAPGSNRKLLSVVNKDTGDEIRDYIQDVDIDVETGSHKHVENKEDVESWKNPALDIYGNSLLYTNRQFDISYGHKARKVIAHMPHLIDLDVINQMYQKFSTQWTTTSSHKLRSAEDMQFEFSYFHFLSSEKLRFKVESIFDEFDTDQSSSWSDREIRTLLTRIYSLPLMAITVFEFEELITKCASNATLVADLPQPILSSYPPFERYYDSKLPAVVTKELVTGL